MTLHSSSKPTWLTFDCYGTLIQWDEGLKAAVHTILQKKGRHDLDPEKLIDVYDRQEHAIEQERPYRSFREVSAEGLRRAMHELNLPYDEQDARVLTDRIGAMPPFTEVVDTLKSLKDAGYKLCIVSNTDDDIISGNVAQLGGTIDCVITAQQAEAYKPSRVLFEYAYAQLGVTQDDVVHICASPRLDHAAAREMGFRCVWIDRGTGRHLLPDYTPDVTLTRLDQVPALFASLGWS